METSCYILTLVSDAPTPQEALNVALAATERAQSARARPRWALPLIGLLVGGDVTLVHTALPSDGPTNKVLLAVALVLALMLFGLLARFKRAWKAAAGIVPRSLYDQPVQEWKRLALLFVSLTLCTFAAGLLSGWMYNIPSGLVYGGWTWFALARWRAPSCRN